MGAGEPKAFFPTSQMNGSGLCGYPSGTEAATNTSSAAQPSVKNDAIVALKARWATLVRGELGGDRVGALGVVVFWLL